MHGKKDVYCIQWSTVNVADEQYNIEDEEPETIEFEGNELSRDEFSILLEGQCCDLCGTPLEFISGHKYHTVKTPLIHMKDGLKIEYGHKEQTLVTCADCIEEMKDIPNKRSSHC